MSLLLLFQSGPGIVDANLAVTLGAKTVASTATVGITATLAKTLGATTLSSTATVAIAATLSKTLGAKTLASTATVTTPGSGSPRWRHRRRRHIR